MNHRPPGGERPDSERYLRDTGDAFFFDPQSGIHKPKAYQNPTERGEPTSKTTPVWQFWVTTILSALTLLAVAIYACYAKLQWYEMNKTYGEIQKQTIFQQQQTVGTYAAVIPKAFPRPETNFNDLELLNYQGINLNYVNVGKVKATNFVAEATMIRQVLPSYKPFGVPDRKQINLLQIRPNDQPIPEGGTRDTASIRFDAKMLTEHDLALLHDMRETIEISG